jgi:NDP-sugar pyrophosphorylase family protein
MVKASVLNHSNRWKFKLEFNDEDKPLGTAGALTKLSPESDQLLVINGDTLTDLNFIDLLSSHKNQKADITIASYKRFVNIEYGVLVTNYEKELIDYQEKPVLNYLVSMGIYVVNTGLLNIIPKDYYFDFPSFILKAKKKNYKISLYTHGGYWKDLGNLADINEAIEDYSKVSNIFL